MLLRIIRGVLAALVIISLLAVVGGGWYFSSVLEEDGLRIDNAPEALSLEVIEVSSDRITLTQREGFEEEERIDEAGVWGVARNGGYGRISEIIEAGEGRVVRSFEILEGSIKQGDFVFIDRSAHPIDPIYAHNLEFSTVSFEAPLGELDAWLIEGSSDNWVIFVHGRTSNKDEFLKLVDDVQANGWNSLVIDYRNDAGAPSSDSGYYDFGATEWEDLEAAVEFALAAGAEDIVLFGSSMGGGVIAAFEQQTAISKNTSGLILDAPMLDFGKTVDKGAEERSVPGIVTLTAKQFASLRFGVEWDSMNFLKDAASINKPVLILHGDEDDTVPIATSREFADLNPEMTTLEVFEGASHAAGWNHEPERYETLVTEFLSQFE
jgi:pimeloyl-ACP methyl ester carboxylesterase